jgi:thiosulfate reductase cytochrome b subunit
MKLALTIVAIIVVLALVMFVVAHLFMCYVEKEYNQTIENYEDDNEPRVN